MKKTYSVLSLLTVFFAVLWFMVSYGTLEINVGKVFAASCEVEDADWVANSDQRHICEGNDDVSYEVETKCQNGTLNERTREVGRERNSTRCGGSGGGSSSTAPAQGMPPGCCYSNSSCSNGQSCSISNGACASGLSCDPNSGSNPTTNSSNRTDECRSDTQCEENRGSGYVCRSNQCVSSESAGVSSVTPGAGSGVPTVEGTECSGSNPCSDPTKSCVNGACVSNQAANPALNQPTYNQACTGTCVAPYVCGEAGVCRCPDGTQLERGSTAQCTSAGGASSICNPSRNDCAQGYYCRSNYSSGPNGVCTAGCRADGDCHAGYRCDASTNQCVFISGVTPRNPQADQCEQGGNFWCGGVCRPQACPPGTRPLCSVNGTPSCAADNGSEIGDLDRPNPTQAPIPGSNVSCQDRPGVCGNYRAACNSRNSFSYGVCQVVVAPILFIGSGTISSRINDCHNARVEGIDSCQDTYELCVAGCQ